MSSDDPRMGGFAAREILLAAAARAVIAAFREPAEQKRLTPAADASLRLLEGALQPYPSTNLEDFAK